MPTGSTSSKDLTFILKMKDEMTARLKEVEGGIKKTGDATEQAEGKFKSFGKTAVALGAALAAAGAAAGIFVKSITEFRAFETGLNEVQRAVNLTDSEMMVFAETIKDVAVSGKTTTAELMEIAAAAGEVGVRGVKDITEFTKVLAKLGTISDVAGAQGASQLGEFIRISGASAKEVGKFANILARMNNDLGVSEKKTLDTASTIAALTARFGVSGEKAIAMGAAIQNSGIRAELAARAVSGAMNSIERAIAEGGEKMQALSNLTGIASKDLSKAFGDDATRVFLRFVRGLKEVSDGGGNLATQLKTLEISAAEAENVFLPLASKTDLLARAFASAGDEAKTQTTLMEEYNKAMQTLDNKSKELRNTFVAIFLEIGTAIAPVVSAMIDMAQVVGTTLLEAFRSLPEGMKLAVSLFATLIPMLGALVAVAVLIAPLFVGMATALGVLVGPVGIAVLIIGRLIYALNDLGVQAAESAGLHTTVGQRIGAAYSAMVEYVKEKWQAFINSLQLSVELAKVGFQALYEVIAWFATAAGGRLAAFAKLAAAALTFNAPLALQSFKDLSGGVEEELDKMYAGVGARLVQRTNEASGKFKTGSRTFADIYIDELRQGVQGAAMEAIDSGGDKPTMPQVDDLFKAWLGLGKDGKVGAGALPGLEEEAQKASDDLKNRLLGIRAQIAENMKLLAIKDQVGVQRERSVALIRAESAAIADGRKLTQAEIDLTMKLAEAQYALANARQSARAAAQQFFMEYQQDATDFGAATKSILETATSQTEDLLFTFFSTGKLEVKDFIRTMLAEFMKLYVIKSLVSNIFGTIGLGATPSLYADGGAFGGNGVVPFAKGDVVNRPTMFNFNTPQGRRTGVMGEAGAEAVMPLERGSDGKLGVSVKGGMAGGGVFQYSSTFNIDLGASGGAPVDQRAAANLSRSIDNQVRVTVLDVIQRESRPGGALYGGR